MVQIVPIVQHDTLIYRFNRATHILIVGDREWFIWLGDARHFAYVDDSGTFTAYKERAGNRRGKSYWCAYRRQGGRLRRVYLGASRELSAARLHAAAAQLAQSDASRQHTAPALDKQLHASLERGHTTALAQTDAPPAEPLSEREREVLHLIAHGHSNQEIADQLVIALSTVKMHVKHLYAKLGVHSRTQSIVRANVLGLLSGNGALEHTDA